MHAGRFLASAQDTTIQHLSAAESFVAQGQTDAAFEEVELALNSLISGMGPAYAAVYPGAFTPRCTLKDTRRAVPEDNCCKSCGLRTSRCTRALLSVACTSSSWRGYACTSSCLADSAACEVYCWAVIWLHPTYALHFAVSKAMTLARNAGHGHVDLSAAGLGIPTCLLGTQGSRVLGHRRRHHRLPLSSVRPRPGEHRGWSPPSWIVWHLTLDVAKKIR